MGEIWRGGTSLNSAVRREMQAVRVKDKSVTIPRRPSIDVGSTHVDDKRVGLSVSAIIASKGGGSTYVKCWFSSDDFRELAEAMMRADPEKARAAFASAVDNPNRTHEETMRRYHERELAKLKAGS